jgi:hypothetical protein
MGLNLPRSGLVQHQDAEDEQSSMPVGCTEQLPAADLELSKDREERARIAF